VSQQGSDNSAGSPRNDAGGDGVAQSHAVLHVVVYTAARLLLAVVLTAAIYGVARLAGITQFPLVVAALSALVIAMPLGIWVFSPLRRRATAALAISGERRRREREVLQARLRGDATPDEARDDG
jgi:hypothetical protein